MASTNSLGHGRSPLYYAALGNHREVVVTGPRVVERQISLKFVHLRISNHFRTTRCFQLTVERLRASSNFWRIQGRVTLRWFWIQILLIYVHGLGIPKFAKALLVDRGHADQSILFHALKAAGGTGGPPKLPKLETCGGHFLLPDGFNLPQTQRHLLTDSLEAGEVWNPQLHVARLARVQWPLDVVP